MARLPAATRYYVWLAAHRLTLRQHAEEGGHDQSNVTAVISGRRTSRPIKRWIETETGISADDPTWAQQVGGASTP